MKNPWMSLWLSAANKAAGTSRSLWAAEAARQQQAYMKAMTEAMTKAMMPGLPSTSRKTPAKRHK